MSYLEVFGVKKGVGVAVCNFFRVGAGVLKPEAGAESEKCDSAHLCSELQNPVGSQSGNRIIFKPGYKEAFPHIL